MLRLSRPSAPSRWPVPAGPSPSLPRRSATACCSARPPRPRRAARHGPPRSRADRADTRYAAGNHPWLGGSVESAHANLAICTCASVPPVRGSVERSGSAEFAELYRCDSSALRSCVVLVPVWRSCGCAGSIGCTVRHAIRRVACTRARGLCFVVRRVAQRRWRSRGRRGEVERSALSPKRVGRIDLPVKCRDR